MLSFTAAKAGLLHAVAGCHGPLLDKSDAEETDVPVCLLNSKAEPETYKTEIKPIMMDINTKNKDKKNVFKEFFATVHHGWMGTCGIGTDTDFSDEVIATKYAEGVSDLLSTSSSQLYRERARTTSEERKVESQMTLLVDS